MTPTSEKRRGEGEKRRPRLTGAGRSLTAEQHRRTREARAVELAQDYVEVIDDLIAQHGEARVVDIARALGVTHVTVTRTVVRLKKQGLVQTERYRSIFLSPAGKALARRVRKRHATVLEFLLALGVSESIARIDAEGIEHHVSEQTVQAFAKYCKTTTSGKGVRVQSRRGDRHA